MRVYRNYRTKTLKASAGEDERASGNIKNEKSDNEKEKDDDRGNEDTSDASSTKSYATAADDVSIYSSDHPYVPTDFERTSASTSDIPNAIPSFSTLMATQS